MKKTYGYARVSSRDQHLDRQIKALLDCGVAERDIVTDKISGTSLEREGYMALRNTMLRDGGHPDHQILRPSEPQQAAYSPRAAPLQGTSHTGQSDRSPHDDDPAAREGQEWVFEMINNILIEVLASIAEQERLTTRQRQAEGIAVAKEKGTHLGRPAATYPPDWNQIYTRWKNGTITAVRAMNDLGLKRSTFYKLVHRYEEGLQ